MPLSLLLARKTRASSVTSPSLFGIDSLPKSHSLQPIQIAHRVTFRWIAGLGSELFLKNVYEVHSRKYCNVTLHLCLEISSIY